MATYDDSFLALVESVVKGTQAQCFDEHTELVGDVMVALNLCFSLPFTSRALHGNTALEFACVTHLSRSATDYYVALDLFCKSFHPQGANATGAGFEAACQGS